jgi:hypothetical protein
VTGQYGMLVEFRSAEALIAAVQRVRGAGYRRLEAFSPMPVEGLAEALGRQPDRIPLLTLLGGICGGVGGYFMQWYAATISYPLNIGGRPLHSWPSFIPIAFETTILGAALAAVFGMLVCNGLPRLYHPLFNVREFELASRNRFFLCLRSDDPHYDADAVRDLLGELQPVLIRDVPL